MNISGALILLEDAVNRSKTEDVATPEVLAALDFLAARATVHWPFEQFRKAIITKDGELDVT